MDVAGVEEAESQLTVDSLSESTDPAEKVRYRFNGALVPFFVVVVLIVLDLDVLLSLLACVLGGVLGLLAGLLAGLRSLGLWSRFGRLSTLGCGLAELLGSVARLPAELGGSLGGAGLLPACRWGRSHVI